MRLWSIHPCYLDAKGLVALWREGLLAQNVLLGKTKGYKNHPQLIRFKNTTDSVGAISSYLSYVLEEASHRNYKFNAQKISNRRFKDKVPVTKGQLKYEFEHLLNKLKIRDLDLYSKVCKTKKIIPHPMFIEINGKIENWEIV